MPCEHLRELYSLCEKHDLRISSQDAIRVVCRQCEEQDVCPSSLTDGESVLRVSEKDSADDENSGDTTASDKPASHNDIGDKRPR